MSYVYTIALKETASRTIKVSDGIDSQLDILPILTSDKMASLLSDELASRGFTHKKDQMLCQMDAITSIAIAPQSAKVKIRATREKAEQISATLQVGDPSSSSHDYSEKKEKSLKIKYRQQLQAQLEQSTKERKNERTMELTRELEKRLSTIEELLDDISQAVVSKALKLRADQLGEIQEISEDQETGELVIKVRV